MVGDECEITTINEQGNSAILNKKGWVFDTYSIRNCAKQYEGLYKLVAGMVSQDGAAHQRAVS